MALDFSIRDRANNNSLKNTYELCKSSSSKAEVLNLISGKKICNPAPPLPWYGQKSDRSTCTVGIFNCRQKPLGSPLEFACSAYEIGHLTSRRNEDQSRLHCMYGLIIGAMLASAGFGVIYVWNENGQNSQLLRLESKTWKDFSCAPTHAVAEPSNKLPLKVRNETFSSELNYHLQRNSEELEIGFDYSLSTLGARVISTRYTKPLSRFDISLFGIPLYHSNLEEFMEDAPLQPIVIPGRCWRFAEFPGNLVVQLVERIRITSFTLSHVLGASVPLHRLRSAPKDFQVWGLESPYDSSGHFFGNYSFKLIGQPSTQKFPVHNFTNRYFPIVELIILNNHGLKEYTCVYRFKVFGVPVDDEAGL